MSLYLGIDFGTSTNVVTCWDEVKKKVNCIPLGKFGNPNVFPNVIYYQSPTNIIVGDEAVEKGKQNPENAVFAIKRQLESPEFHRYIPSLGRSLGSEDIAADIFSWIKRKVENAYGGQSVDGVVISVPFAFQNRERKRIERAAQQAGLPVLGLIEEPVAAAISFGLMEQAERGKAEKILVFDLGGGTFDVTIFDFRKQSDRQFAIKVITTDGAKNLGGIDIDNMIVDKILEKMTNAFPEYKLETRKSDLQEQEVFKIHQLAVESKELWSTEEEADFFFESTFGEDFCFDETIGRDDFDTWLKKFLNDVENVLDDALTDADLDPENIDRIIMVGGTSNIPVIRDKVREYFGKEPQKAESLTLMVGEGAGIYCGLKYVEKSLECKISVGVSQNIGVKWGGHFLEMLERNTLYGTPSQIKILTIRQPGQKEVVIPIVQGNSIQNARVGSVSVSPEIQQKLNGGKLGLKLNTDVNNGTINYELYRVTEKNRKFEPDNLLKSGKAEEE